jgi:hypothetical protein
MSDLPIPILPISIEWIFPAMTQKEYMALMGMFQIPSELLTEKQGSKASAEMQAMLTKHKAKYR